MGILIRNPIFVSIPLMDRSMDLKIKAKSLFLPYLHKLCCPEPGETKTGQIFKIHHLVTSDYGGITTYISGSESGHFADVHPHRLLSEKADLRGDRSHRQWRLFPPYWRGPTVGGAYTYGVLTMTCLPSRFMPTTIPTEYLGNGSEKSPCHPVKSPIPSNHTGRIERSKCTLHTMQPELSYVDASDLSKNKLIMKLYTSSFEITKWGIPAATHK